MKWVEIGVNGMTCSMCTRSVEMSVRTLSFVDSVVMSLDSTDGKVYLKPGAPVDLKKIARAVTDAGFSVRFVRVSFTFDDVVLTADGSFTYQGQVFSWLDFKGPLKEQATLQLVDEGFLPRKESLLWKKKLPKASDGKKPFHVVAM